MISEIKLSTHAFLPKKELKNLEQARQKLTVTSTYDENNQVELFRDLPGVFGVPLYYFKNLSAKKISDLRIEGSKIQYNFTSTLRPNQSTIFKQFKRYLTSGNTGFILNCKPGWGKTTCLIKMIQELQRSALVVVPRSNLVDQWVQRFLDHTDLPKSRIGWVNGKQVKVEGVSVIIGLVHSLARYQNESFSQMFGTIVFDEVDRSVPPVTFAPVVEMFPARYRIGASATINRRDGMNAIFDYHIGQCYLYGKDEGRMIPKVLIHHYEETSGYVHPTSQKLNRRGMLLSRLSENRKRNYLILKYLKMIYNSDRRCIVISDRVAQLNRLMHMANDHYGIPFEEMGFYVRQVPTDILGNKKRTMKKSELDRVASDCKILFASYGMMSIGTDIPDLAGLIYATPQSDIEQTKGRIERMCDGKSQPVIVDIIDTAYPDAIIWGKQRERQYRFANLEIKYK